MPGVPPANTWSTIAARFAIWSIRPSTAALTVRDDGVEVPNKFEAPKTRLMALIIDGILKQKLALGTGVDRRADRRDAGVGRRAVAAVCRGRVSADSIVGADFCRRRGSLAGRQASNGRPRPKRT